jgi:hypothetical protein
VETAAAVTIITQKAQMANAQIKKMFKRHKFIYFKINYKQYGIGHMRGCPNRKTINYAVTAITLYSEASISVTNA